MAEYDEGWKRLVEAARRANTPVGDLTPRRIAELARFAGMRSAENSERRSLLALAALLACVLLALVPWHEQVGEFLEDASADLAALPARVPRPPHPPSGALALAALLDLSPFTKDSPP